MMDTIDPSRLLLLAGVAFAMPLGLAIYTGHARLLTPREHQALLLVVYACVALHLAQTHTTDE